MDLIYYQNALKALEDGLSLLQEKLSKVDKTIEDLREQDPKHPAIDMIEPQRLELRAEIDRLQLAVSEMSNLANGVETKNVIGGGITKLRPGQYKSVRRLATAVMAYLLHYPGFGPVQITELADILNKAGVTVQTRNGKDKGKRFPIEARNIRIMASSYKSGFSSIDKESPFIYDKVRDTIALKVYEDEVKVTSKTKSGGGLSR
jgi:hypothetical protein